MANETHIEHGRQGGRSHIERKPGPKEVEPKTDTAGESNARAVRGGAVRPVDDEDQASDRQVDETSSTTDNTANTSKANESKPAEGDELKAKRASKTARTTSTRPAARPQPKAKAAKKR